MNNMPSSNESKISVGIPVNVTPGGGNNGKLSNNNANDNGNNISTGSAVNLPQRVNNTIPTNLTQQQQELQQKQRMLMQQRALQQQRHQQAMQNFENQFYQLLMTLNKKPKRIYNFVEDTDSILQKYEQYRPSFEFHIYENNYKICAPANSRIQQQQNQQQQKTELSNDGLVLTKNNETLKEFLEYVARGCIPEAIMEVLRDCNIQFYEGNLILQVYDHTNTVEVVIKEKQSSQPPASNQANSVSNPATNSNTNQSSQNIKREDSNISVTANNSSLNSKADGPITNTTQADSNIPSDTTAQSTAIATPNNLPNSTDNKQTNEKSEQGKPNNIQNPKVKQYKRPRVYRTLLRPNDLTHYYDMMTYADQARFSDSIYQQLESEVLNLTKRNIQLDVDLNPYDNRDKIDEGDFSIPKWDEINNKINFIHREESTREGTKGIVGHIEEHEELPQHSSNYEQLMLIMNERTTTSTNSTFAAALAKHAIDVNSNNSHTSISSGQNGRQSSVGPTSPPSSSALLGNNKNSSNSNQVSIAAAAAAAAVGSNNENNQFNRLKFIEQWRVNKEKRKQQNQLNASIPGTPFNTKISMTLPLTPQQQLLQQKQQQTKGGDKKSGGQRGTKRGNNGINDKPKAKKPRKTKKPSTADGTTAPKKKRVTKKQQQQQQQHTVAKSQQSSVDNKPSSTT